MLFQKQLIKFISIAFVTLFLGACSKPIACLPESNYTTNKLMNSSSEDSSNKGATSSKSGDLEVIVGVDGSGSMIGFADIANSRYREAIDALHLAMQNKILGQTQVRYWRIGNSPDGKSAQQSLTPASFLDARQEWFYCKKSDNPAAKPYPCITSALNQIFELNPNSGQPQLRILLTDLEPDGNAISLLSGKISTILDSQPSYEAALIGVRSEFNGIVFPASPGDFQPFSYSTDGKSLQESGRPFYLLLVGPSPAVDKLIKSLFSSLSTTTSQAFRVSRFRQENSTALTIDPDSVSFKEQCGQRIFSLRQGLGKISPVKGQEADWLLLRLRCPSTTPVQLNVQSKSTVGLAIGELEPSMFSVSPTNHFQVLKAEADDNRLSLDLNLRGGGLVFGQIDISQDKLNKFQWQAWDAGNDKSGHKTQNLLLFVSGIQQALSRNASPGPAIRFCIAYQS